MGISTFLGTMATKSDEHDQLTEKEKNIFWASKPHDIFYVKRNIQNALFEKVGTALRSVKIDVDEMRKIIYFWFYYDGEISQKDRLNSETVIEYLKNLFVKKFLVEGQIIRLDFPKEIPFIGLSVYQRAE